MGIAVAEGSFGAYMKVTYTNEGPVTIILDSKKRI
jgi:D-Tyr-tRNAtyr deacylase